MSFDIPSMLYLGPLIVVENNIGEKIGYKRVFKNIRIGIFLVNEGENEIISWSKKEMHVFTFYNEIRRSQHLKQQIFWEKETYILR